MSLSQIAEGWFNSFLNELNVLDEETKKLGESRLSICKNCPVRTENVCDSRKYHMNEAGKSFRGCGCPIKKKVLCVSCKCPGDLW